MGENRREKKKNKKGSNVLTDPKEHKENWQNKTETKVAPMPLIRYRSYKAKHIKPNLTAREQ